MSNSILVFGASGSIGAPLVKDFLSRGEKVQTASRSGKTMEGAKGVRFEFGTATDFEVLLRDVDRVFLLAPTGYPDAVKVLSPVVDAAAARNVKIVYLSAPGAGEHEDHEHAKVERILKTSGTNFVSLRPNWFLDNFHTFWKSDILRGKIRLPAAQGKSSFIDARDVAACAAAALSTNRFNGRAFDLTGPEALSYAQAAEILSAATGKTVTYTPLSEEEYVRLRSSEGVPPEFARTIATIFAPVREGETALVTNAYARGLCPRSRGRSHQSRQTVNEAQLAKNSHYPHSR